MARRRKKSSRRKKTGDFALSEGVKQSILAIVLLSAGAIILLAYFELAGVIGQGIDHGLAALMGWDRWLLALVLFGLSWGILLPHRSLFSAANLVGVLLFFLAFNGLLNLLLVDPVAPTNEALFAAGGYVGLLVSSVLAGFLGFWGALVIALAALFVGFFIAFNFSLHSILSAPTHLGSLSGILRRENGEKTDENAYMDATDEEDVEEYEEPEEDEEDVRVVPRPSAAAESFDDQEEEQVMTSTRRRQIQVPVDILNDASSEAKSGDIERSGEIIRKTLENFNIDVEMCDVRVGPSVTQYALRPAQGVKLTRIVGLQNDLALALAAHPIRIEAPIPGKSLVGIEVPNQTVGMVSLRELLESREFKNRKSSLMAPLGKDVGGRVDSVLVDKAPHMLVAGATGSGKSVCLNIIITSLLYQNGPDDLKLIMVDPKRVELGVYAGIPHLLVPPITKVEEAINALKWAVREMERRLDHLAKFGARDIDAYNAKSKERMPKIVIVIDELADLMSQNKRDVEAVIVRIAQMARAAGIHLILATQRPSVDVITGTIKANIPTRLAFAVASQVDSKTILDMSGAEKLLGRGDMLMTSPAISKPKRLQGAYVSDDEIERVVNFLKKEGEPDYNYQVTEDARTGGTVFSEEESDPMMNEAIEEVIRSQKASTSYLQRRLRIGYSRAARIVDLMEEMGVIGPQQGSKPREVLVDTWPPAGSASSRPAKQSSAQDFEGQDAYEEDDFETDVDEDEEWEDVDGEEDEEYDEEEEQVR